jgi:hypothetical protein
MEKYQFVNEWLSLMFKLIKCSRGYQFKMRQSGHLSPKLFTLQNPAKELTVMALLRIMVNWAMACQLTDKKDEFMDNWMRLGMMIRDFADSERADHFNSLFEKHKN